MSHELGLDEAPDAYRHFDARDNGWTKVVLHPGRTVEQWGPAANPRRSRVTGAAPGRCRRQQTRGNLLRLRDDRGGKYPPAKRVMKIAMISTPFLRVPPRDYGGTELVVYELVEGLVRRGHDVTLFATGDSATSAELALALPHWPVAAGLFSRSGPCHLGHARGDRPRRFRRGPRPLRSRARTPRLRRRPPMVYTLHHARDQHLSSFYRRCHDAHFVAISADQARREIHLPVSA